MKRKTTDKEALNEIQRVMSGQEWNAETLDYIADLVRETGREIKDLEENENE